jgi:hypothetical protein
MKPAFRIILSAAALIVSSGASAHGGGLNADGCHNNRKTGDYHCHRSPAASASQAPARNLAQAEPRSYGNRGKGGAFANCAEARAAGAAPVRIGEPGYGAHLDRDGDGIGCEASRGRR